MVVLLSMSVPVLQGSDGEQEENILLMHVGETASFWRKGCAVKGWETRLGHKSFSRQREDSSALLCSTVSCVFQEGVICWPISLGFSGWIPSREKGDAHCSVHVSVRSRRRSL